MDTCTVAAWGRSISGCKAKGDSAPRPSPRAAGKSQPSPDPVGSSRWRRERQQAGTARDSPVKGGGEPLGVQIFLTCALSGYWLRSTTLSSPGPHCCDTARKQRALQAHRNRPPQWSSRRALPQRCGWASRPAGGPPGSGRFVAPLRRPPIRTNLMPPPSPPPPSAPPRAAKLAVEALWLQWAPCARGPCTCASTWPSRVRRQIWGGLRGCDGGSTARPGTRARRHRLSPIHPTHALTRAPAAGPIPSENECCADDKVEEEYSAAVAQQAKADDAGFACTRVRPASPLRRSRRPRGAGRQPAAEHCSRAPRPACRPCHTGPPLPRPSLTSRPASPLPSSPALSRRCCGC